jgi:hypothetical protein
LAVIDARLAHHFAALAWLPEDIILAILALIQTAGVVEAGRLQPPL